MFPPGIPRPRVAASAAAFPVAHGVAEVLPSLNGPAFDDGPVSYACRVAEASLIAPPCVRSETEVTRAYESMKQRFYNSPSNRLAEALDKEAKE